ncbi:MAG: hypothetical protein JWQ11_3457, partial [Rhizobacter sp.]|nr:hypothetical protein [Rhizobacter sp.]
TGPAEWKARIAASPKSALGKIAVSVV